MPSDKPVFITALPGYDAQASVDAAVEQCFAALACTAALGPQSRVLLKPNLLAKHPPEKAVTTHPAVVAAVIRALRARGVEQIVLADSPGGLYNPAGMRSIYQVSGLAAVCEEQGVACYTGCKWGVRPVRDGRVAREFTLIDPVLEADFIIDLPKMKTHVMTGCTAAVKNLFGCVPGLQKAEWHTRFPDRERFGEMLIDLLETVRPQMAILDAGAAMEGDGPSGGELRQVGLLMASEDLPALDLAVCGLMGLDPMRVPYLRAAQRRGLCAERFDPARLTGQPGLWAPILGYKLPGSYAGQDGSTDFAAHYGGPLGVLARQAERVVAPHPVVEQAKCIGCGKCAEICPQKTIELREHKGRRRAQIRSQSCIRCFCCHEMCPVKAIAVRQFSLFRL